MPRIGIFLRHFLWTNLPIQPDRAVHQGALAEPWLSFLKDIDDQLNEEIALHCMGGFAVVQAYGLEWATADIEVIAVLPAGTGSQLVALAGKESALRAQYGVYLDVVTVVSVPEAYESRLGALYPGSWRSARP